MPDFFFRSIINATIIFCGCKSLPIHFQFLRQLHRKLSKIIEILHQKRLAVLKLITTLIKIKIIRSVLESMLALSGHVRGLKREAFNEWN